MACRLDGAKPLSEPMLEYYIVEYGRKTESNTSTSWELQYRKWHLNSSVNKQDACPWLRMLA